MPTPTKIKVSKIIERKILIHLESNDSRSFLETCNLDKQSFGSKGSEKRRHCQKRRDQLCALARDNPISYKQLLLDHNIETMPAQTRSKATTEVVDDLEEEAPRTTTKQSAKSPSRKEAPKAAATTTNSSIKTEPKNVGKWIHMTDGREVYADKVVPVGIERDDAFLNAHLEYVQYLPKVQFETEDAIANVSCIALYQYAEVRDIQQGLVKLYLTKTPNALAMVTPMIPGSLRVEVGEDDDEDDQMKKLRSVKRNFMVRNLKTGKMDQMWCQSAWEEHTSTLNHFEKSQAEEGKPFEVAVKVVLLVFPEHIRFSTKFSPQLQDAQGVLLRSSELIKVDGQGISRVRWLIPTTNHTIMLNKRKKKATDDIADRMRAGMKIDDEDDELENEGMVF